MVHLMNKLLGGPLGKLSGLLGMNSVAAAGMVATSANNIPMFAIMKNMDDRDKVTNVAFCVNTLPSPLATTWASPPGPTT